jgi:hypothetical protein
MEQGKWDFFVKFDELVDGVYMITITDDVLDADCWPIHYITIKTGIVLKQGCVFNSTVYDMPDMVGWDTTQVAEWTQAEPGNNHPQIGHNIMQLSV